MRRSILFLVLSMLLVGMSSLSKSIPPNKKTFSNQGIASFNSAPIIQMTPMFYEARNFSHAIDGIRKIAPQNNIQAIIVPQHLLASKLIAEQMQRASGRKIETVVIIGPNHFNVGTDIVATTQASWKTPIGTVHSNSVLTNQLINEFNLVDNATVFTEEHSVGAITPFIKYFFPEASIVPIVFNSYASSQHAKKVAEWISENLPEDTLVIFSIDFSHYLSREEADLMDIQTKEAFLQGNIDRIMSFGNEHLDSPASLVTAIEYAKNNNLKTTILSIQNSDDFSIIRNPETTSYFIATFLE